MKIEEEVLINQYGQSLIDENEILICFNGLTDIQKEEYLSDLVELILQSRPKDCDINTAIEHSHLRSTYTPCVLLARGGVKYHNLKKIVDLPSSEKAKSLILFLNLFRVSYQRRFIEERARCGKWWYSEKEHRINIETI